MTKTVIFQRGQFLKNNTVNRIGAVFQTPHLKHHEPRVESFDFINIEQMDFLANKQAPKPI